jgi:L-ascorbate metabolism protein UlaG (beta-lactamase superfamily)
LSLLLACRPTPPAPESPVVVASPPVRAIEEAPKVPEPAPLPSIEMRFLGNEAFLVRVDDHALLFDAVLGRGLPDYPLPSREDRARIEAGDPPFDGVLVAFASHHHADHFDARAAVRFLDGHDDAHLVTTAQAVRRMDPKAVARHRDRIHGLSPPVDAPSEIEIGPASVRAFAMHHGPGGAQNLGFLVTLAGRKLLHVGDTQLSADELEALPVTVTDRPVDVAMIPYWHLTQNRWQAALAHTFAPERVVMMHLPTERAPQRLYGPGQTRDELLERVRERFGDEAIFTAPGTVRVFQSHL